MNWMRTMIAAVVGGVLMWLAAFVLHGIVMGDTYVRYAAVFTQEAANPMWFLALEILIAFPAAVIFGKTRGSWSPGVGGGLAFGFWLGLVGAFAQFFNPLILEGFPYFLSWCWFGINMILTLLLGAVLGVMIKTR